MNMVLIRSTADKPWRSRKTYGLIEEGLRSRWKNVRSVSAGSEEELALRLSGQGNPGSTFVFNVAEYIDERRKRGFLPGLLDAWGYPHLGSPVGHRADRAR